MCGLYSLPRSGIRIVSGKVVYYVKDIPTLNTLDDRVDSMQVSEKVYFMKQTVGNACGTIGLLHAVGNNLNQVDLGMHLARYSIWCVSYCITYLCCLQNLVYCCMKRLCLPCEGSWHLHMNLYITGDFLQRRALTCKGFLNQRLPWLLMRCVISSIALSLI